MPFLMIHPLFFFCQHACLLFSPASVQLRFSVAAGSGTGRPRPRLVQSFDSTARACSIWPRVIGRRIPLPSRRCTPRNRNRLRGRHIQRVDSMRDWVRSSVLLRNTPWRRESASSPNSRGEMKNKTRASRDRDRDGHSLTHTGTHKQRHLPLIMYYEFPRTLNR